MSATRPKWATTVLPTVLERDGTRRVHDPLVLDGPGRKLNTSGGVDLPGSGAGAVVLLLVVVAAAVLVPLWLATGVLSAVLWGAGAAGVAVVAGSLGYTSVFPDPVARYRKERGGDPFVDVGDGTDQAHLCDLATAVATSSAWQQARVDPDRLLPATLWNAVKLAEHVGNQSADLARDRAAGRAEHVLAPTVDDLAAATGELARVETNLRSLGALARDLDGRAAAAERAAMTMTSAPVAELGLAAAASEAMLDHARTVHRLQ